MNYQIKTLPGLLLIAVWIAGGTVTADADQSELLRQVPAGANSVLLIDAATLQNLEGAAKQRWTQEYGPVRSSSPLTLPAGTTEVVMATEFDLQHMTPLVQMVAVQLSQPVRAMDIARQRKGYTDRVLDKEVVWLEQGCVIMNSPTQVTFVTPLNRQSAARWIRRSEGMTKSALTGYLAAEANRFGAGDFQITMALDLAYIFPPEKIEKLVQDSPVFADGDRSAISKLLTTLQGVAVRCSVVANTCEISIAFGDSTAPLSSMAKEVMARAFQSAGANLGDPDQWDYQAEGNELVARGELTPSILQRLLSLHSLGSSTAGDPRGFEGDAKGNPETNAAPPQQASENLDQQRELRNAQRYFRKIGDVLNDLRRTRSDNSFESATLWVNNYARQISALPKSGVDEALLEHGYQVQRGLEDIVDTLSRAQDKVNNMAPALPPPGAGTTVTAIPYRRINYGGHYQFRYAPMVTHDYSFEAAAISEQQRAYQEEVDAANEKSRQIVDQLISEHAQVGREMTEKYGVSF